MLGIIFKLRNYGSIYTSQGRFLGWGGFYLGPSHRVAAAFSARGCPHGVTFARHTEPAPQQKFPAIRLAGRNLRLSNMERLPGNLFGTHGDGNTGCAKPGSGAGDRPAHRHGLSAAKCAT